MRKVLVALALLLSATATADAGSLKYQAKVTAYTVDGEKVDEQVLDCPNITGMVQTCQFSFSVPFEGEPWKMSVHINEPTPGILAAKVGGAARPPNSWDRPGASDRLAKESGAIVEIESQWTDRRVQGNWAEQQVTVARFKVEVQ